MDGFADEEEGFHDPTLDFLIKFLVKKYKDQKEAGITFMKTKIHRHKTNLEHSHGKNWLEEWRNELKLNKSKPCKLCFTGFPESDKSSYCDCCQQLPKTMRDVLQKWSKKEDKQVMTGKNRENPLLSWGVEKKCEGCESRFIPTENNQRYCDVCQIVSYPIHEALENKVNEKRTPYYTLNNVKIPLTVIKTSFQDYRLPLSKNKLFFELIYGKKDIKELEGYKEEKHQYLRWCKYCHCQKPFITTNYREKYHPICKRDKNAEYQRERRRKFQRNRKEAIYKAREEHGDIMSHHSTGKGTGSLGGHANPDFDKERVLVEKEFKRMGLR